MQWQCNECIGFLLELDFDCNLDSVAQKKKKKLDKHVEDRNMQKSPLEDHG